MHVTENNHHHEEDLSTQKMFKEQSLILAQVCEMINSFLDDGPDRLALDFRNVLGSWLKQFAQWRHWQEAI